MRKSILAVLLVMSIILIFCAGCGSSNDEPVAAVSATMAPTPEPTAEPEATPEPTAEPEATPEPTEEPAEEEPAEEQEEKPEESTSNNNSGNTQSQATAKPEPTAEPEPEVDKFSVAQNMMGRSVQDLFAAIGQPNGSEYTTSCLVFDGEDGLLYYDGFTVSTVRYSDGTELVMGAY